MDLSLIIDNGLITMLPIGIRNSYSNADIIDIFNSRNDVSSAVIHQYYKIKRNVEYQSVGKSSLYPIYPIYKGTNNTIINNHNSRQYFARIANKYNLFRRVLDLAFQYNYNIRRKIARPIKLVHFNINSAFTLINGDYYLYEYNPYVNYGKVYLNTLNSNYMFYSEYWTEWLIYKEYPRSSLQYAYAFLIIGKTNPLQGDWRYGQYAISNGANDPTGNNDNNDPISNFVINTFIEN